VVDGDVLTSIGLTGPTAGPTTIDEGGGDEWSNEDEGGTGRRARRHQSRRRRRWLAAAASAMVVLALGSWMALAGGSGSSPTKVADRPATPGRVADRSDVTPDDDHYDSRRARTSVRGRGHAVRRRRSDAAHRGPR